MEELIMTYEDKMEKSLDNLYSEYTSIRAGRANPHILDKITVDYYGTPTPLQQVGNISVPEARMIVIQPWEASILKDIEKAESGELKKKDVLKKYGLNQHSLKVIKKLKNIS